MFKPYFDEGTRTWGEEWIDEGTAEGHAASIRESFARIRRTRACYRCGASPERCECPDEMEPEGAR